MIRDKAKYLIALLGVKEVARSIGSSMATASKIANAERGSDKWEPSIEKLFKANDDHWESWQEWQQYNWKKPGMEESVNRVFQHLNAYRMSFYMDLSSEQIRDLVKGRHSKPSFSVVFRFWQGIEKIEAMIQSGEIYESIPQKKIDRPRRKRPRQFKEIHGSDRALVFSNAGWAWMYSEIAAYDPDSAEVYLWQKWREVQGLVKYEEESAA